MILVILEVGVISVTYQLHISIVPYKTDEAARNFDRQVWWICQLLLAPQIILDLESGCLVDHQLGPKHHQLEFLR